MAKTKLVIIDIEGTLLDVHKSIFIKTERMAFEEIGYLFSDDIISGLNEENRDLDSYYLNDRFPTFPVDEFWKAFDRLNSEFIDTKLVPTMPGARVLLTYLKNNNIKCIATTSFNKKQATELLKRTGLLNFFDKIISKENYKTYKPSPEIYQKALSSYLFTKAEQSIVIDDSPIGCQAAFNANIPYIYIPYNGVGNKDIKENSLAALKGLDEVINILKQIEDGQIIIK